MSINQSNVFIKSVLIRRSAQKRSLKPQTASSTCKWWSCCNHIADTTITQENKCRCISGVVMVNFTILDLKPADSGSYCCRAEISSGLNSPLEVYSLGVVKGMCCTSYYWLSMDFVQCRCHHTVERDMKGWSACVYCDVNKPTLFMVNAVCSWILTFCVCIECLSIPTTSIKKAKVNHLCLDLYVWKLHLYITIVFFP